MCKLFQLGMVLYVKSNTTQMFEEKGARELDFLDFLFFSEKAADWELPLATKIKTSSLP